MLFRFVFRVFSLGWLCRRMKMRARRNHSMQLENIFYRFVLSSLFGYLIGTSFFLNHPDIWQTTCDIISGRLITAFPSPNIPAPVDEQPLSNVYIGMMSVESMLNTRMLSAAETWMKEKGIYVEVISANRNLTITPEQVQRLNKSGINIVELDGVVDRSYPPQKKSFALLRHMYDKHIKDFDWFIRLDDDSYLNYENLRTLLNRVNSSEAHQIGHPGFGKNANDYLKNGENYCMGGPGMIFSRKILQKIRPDLVSCMDRIYTEHEDIEIGRCVYHLSGVACTLAWDVRLYFHQNYQGGTYARNIKTLSNKHITNGIIFHANKDSDHQYHLRVEILKNKITKLLNKIADVEDDMKGFVDKDVRSYVGENGIVPLKWTNIQRSWHFYADQHVVARTEKSLSDILVDNFNNFIHKNPIIYSFDGSHKESRLASSYVVINPLRSMDIMSQVELNYDVLNGKGSVNSESHHVYFHQRFRFAKNAVFVHEPFPLPAIGDNLIANNYDRSVTTASDVVVNFILALSGRSDNFVRFLHNFENTFLTRGEKVNLIVSYFPDVILADLGGEDKSPRDDKAKNDPSYDGEAVQQATMDQRAILDNMASLQTVYPDNLLKVLLMDVGMEFSRGAGLQRAADSIRESDEIIFFCDVDLVFSPEILTHIRRNTVEGKTVYYPVFFSQYDPEVVYAQREKPQSHFHFDELDGFWRYFSYGMVSLYKSDFQRTPGFDLTIRGWGLEDLHLANAILATGLDVFKSTEPGQVHIYHDKSCDSKVLQAKQLFDCKNSRAAHYGPKTLLYYLWNSAKFNSSTPV